MVRLKQNKTSGYSTVYATALKQYQVMYTPKHTYNIKYKNTVI